MRHLEVRAAIATVLVALTACRVSSSAPPRPVDLGLAPPAPPALGASAPASVVAAAPATATASALAGASYAKPAPAQLRQKLTPLQFEVTQNAATEPPFHNAYWDNHAPGIYVDVATGEPLFSSIDKFESGTGWPSFTQPIEDGHVASSTDDTLGMVRTEVRSTAGSSHLGHLFDDGPAPTGKRYCINSAALRFIPVAHLAAEGYGAYSARFASGASEAPAPVATKNACTAPAPGQAPGCAATLDTALLGGDAKTEQALRGVPGILEVDPGAVGPAKALRVVFDPKQISYRDLLGRWAPLDRNEASGSVVYATTDEQGRVAREWSAHAEGQVAPARGVVVRAIAESAFAYSSE